MGDSNKAQPCKSNTFHKQLLKLSVPEAALNTPTQSHCRSTRNVGLHIEKHYFGDNMEMLAEESPLKLIRDDIPSIKLPPKESKSNSESNFEADLKMMRINMVDSPPKTSSHMVNGRKADDISKLKIKLTNAAGPSKTKSDDVKDVARLLQDLKVLVQKHVNEDFQEQFNAIIESLRTTIECQSSAATEESAEQKLASISHIYKRQGTFDIELQEKNAETVDMNEHFKVPDQQMQDPFPDAMIASSATYDGESHTDEKETSPPVLQISGEAQPNKETFMTQVLDHNFVEQINKLLERQNITNNNEQCISTVEQKQTVILVVNSAGPSQLTPQCVPQFSPMKSNKQVDATKHQISATRRRSSSLSIHDKSQLSHIQAKNGLKRTDGNNRSNATKDCNLMINTAGSDKTAMFRQRRNSFSVGLTTNKGSASGLMQINNQQQKHYEQGKVILGARSKNSESIIKSTGPMKPTIPIKRVIPMMKPSSAPTLSTHTITTSRAGGSHDLTLQDPTQTSRKFHTSTPMSQMRCQQRILSKPSGDHTQLCVTPIVRRTSLCNKLDGSSINRPITKTKSPSKFGLANRQAGKFKM
ncbi:uncharacterized protein LOC115627857 isoform X2 [Scaptodrosophila lebanonensis]|nr:uncharacterized protein LOC115627857 isoform X2 [Scaptodrosophila lebanonensis]